MIGDINPIKPVTAKNRVGNKYSSATDKQDHDGSVIRDVVQIGSTPIPDVVYKKPLPHKRNKTHDDTNRQPAESALQQLRYFVENIILQQGKYETATPQEQAQEYMTDFDILTQADQLISQEEEFSVMAVSDCISQFAIQIFSDDQTQLSDIAASIQEGFSAARQTLGGTLPEICKQTYHETMRILDEWIWIK